MWIFHKFTKYDYCQHFQYAVCVLKPVCTGEPWSYMCCTCVPGFGSWRATSWIDSPLEPAPSSCFDHSRSCFGSQRHLARTQCSRVDHLLCHHLEILSSSLEQCAVHTIHVYNKSLYHTVSSKPTVFNYTK